MPVRNLRDGELVIKDNGGANSLTVALDEGDLSWSETHNVVNVLDRGDLSHVRVGDQAPVAGSFTLKFVEFLSSGSGSGPTPYEGLTQTGAASEWTSTNDDNGDVYTVQVEFTISNPDSAGSDEKLTFAKVCPTSIEFREGDEYDTLSVEFQDFEVQPTIAKQ